MEKSEREQLSSGFSESVREGRHCDGESHYAVVPVHHHADHVLVDEGHVLPDVHLYLFVGQAGKFVQDSIGIVEDGEYLLGPAFDVPGLAGYDDREPVFFPDDSVVSRQLLRNICGYVQLALYPVHFFAETQLFEMYTVVWEIIKSSYRWFLVETLHQQPFLVHVGETPRAVHRLQTLLAAPLGHGIDQCLSYFYVVYHVQPAEADILLVPVAVGVVVYDAGNTSDYSTILVSQPVAALAVGECGIGLTQRVHLIRIQRRDIQRVVLVQLSGKFYEKSQVLEGKHLFDNYCHTLA